jgi:predicted transposase YbfD/YdcC
LYTPYELSHGRIDQRCVRTLSVDPVQVNFPCIRTIVEIVRESTQKKSSQQKKGRRLFMADTAHGPPSHMLDTVRKRWNVENKNHHPRDATFLEDKARCSKGNTTANLALLRGISLNLWRKTSPDAPAPAFIARVQKKLDAFIGVIGRNQRLTNLQ